MVMAYRSFSQKCPKKPQKGDFWPKKVVAYWNFRVGSGGLIKSGLLFVRIR